MGLGEFWKIFYCQEWDSRIGYRSSFQPTFTLLGSGNSPNRVLGRMKQEGVQNSITILQVIVRMAEAPSISCPLLAQKVVHTVYNLLPFCPGSLFDFPIPAQIVTVLQNNDVSKFLLGFPFISNDSWFSKDGWQQSKRKRFPFWWHLDIATASYLKREWHRQLFAGK